MTETVGWAVNTLPPALLQMVRRFTPFRSPSRTKLSAVATMHSSGEGAYKIGK